MVVLKEAEMSWASGAWIRWERGCSAVVVGRGLEVFVLTCGCIPDPKQRTLLT